MKPEPLPPSAAKSEMEQPYDSSGRLMLSAYGHKCWDFGYASAKAEIRASEPVQPSAAPALDVERKCERPIPLLRETLSTLCHFMWYRQTRPGEHLWSIPPDKERDFDCIFSDVIDEVEFLRAEVARLRALQTPEK